MCSDKENVSREFLSFRRLIAGMLGTRGSPGGRATETRDEKAIVLEVLQSRQDP